MSSSKKNSARTTGNAAVNWWLKFIDDAEVARATTRKWLSAHGNGSQVSFNGEVVTAEVVVSLNGEKQVREKKEHLNVSINEMNKFFNDIRSRLYSEAKRQIREAFKSGRSGGSFILVDKAVIDEFLSLIPVEYHGRPLTGLVEFDATHYLCARNVLQRMFYYVRYTRPDVVYTGSRAAGDKYVGGATYLSTYTSSATPRLAAAIASTITSSKMKYGTEGQQLLTSPDIMSLVSALSQSVKLSEVNGYDEPARSQYLQYIAAARDGAALSKQYYAELSAAVKAQNPKAKSPRKPTPAKNATTVGIFARRVQNAPQLQGQ